MTFEPACFLEIAAKRGLELGRPVTFRAVTESTNDDALAAAREGAPHGALYVAELQTKGRGRRGNRWYGGAGASLTFTLLLRPSLPLDRVSSLALVAGLAVRAAAAGWLGASAHAEPVLVKWPNDVMIRDRKLCGILAESQVRGTELLAVALGVGLNVGPCDHVPELAGKATSLFDLGLETSAFEPLLADILQELVPRLEAFISDPDATATELKKYDALLGRRIRIVSGHENAAAEAAGSEEAGKDVNREPAVGPGPHRTQDSAIAMGHRDAIAVGPGPHRAQDEPSRRTTVTAAGISRSGSLLVTDENGTLGEVVSGHVELLDD
jgi:BirA family biotin operon repressor/biotin-[acetyl-CoA-carboxylase] ligase